MYKRFLKRAIDLPLAGAALVGLAPLMAMTALAIKLEDGGPVFFVQGRVGRGGEEFRIIKFRSMPANTTSLPSDKAHEVTVTRVGKLIRRMSIDELPQLINILRGDMSIVGPRPPLPSQTELVAARRESGALACTPGLTGLAQINAYDGMPAAEKARWDAVYAKSVSLGTDVKTILRTFKYLTKPPPTC